jgi:hypothetical protein
LGEPKGGNVVLAQYIPSIHEEQETKICPLVPTGRATGTLASTPVIKVPLAVMQLFGIAATAMSYAVLSAREVAAVLELVLVTEFDSNTAPQAVVLAGLIPRTGFAPPVLVRGGFTVREDSAVLLAAFVILP